MGRELGAVCCWGGVIFPIHGEGERRGERAHIQTESLFWILGGEGVEGEGGFRMGLFPPLPCYWGKDN